MKKEDGEATEMENLNADKDKSGWGYQNTLVSTYLYLCTYEIRLNYYIQGRVIVK